jgi:hypothetical protein
VIRGMALSERRGKSKGAVRTAWRPASRRSRALSEGGAAETAAAVGVVCAAGLLPLVSRRGWDVRLPRRAVEILAAATLALAAGYLWTHHVRRFDTRRLRGLDEHTTLLEVARGRPGFLLPCDGLWALGRLQLRTRRPLLLDPIQINMLAKVPDSGPRMADILRVAYDIDLVAGPKRSIGDAWSGFDLARWRRIGRELGVTDVLVSSSTVLPLTLVAQGPLVALYTIPPES